MGTSTQALCGSCTLQFFYHNLGCPSDLPNIDFPSGAWVSTCRRLNAGHVIACWSGLQEDLDHRAQVPLAGSLPIRPSSTPTPASWWSEASPFSSYPPPHCPCQVQRTPAGNARLEGKCVRVCLLELDCQDVRPAPLLMSCMILVRTSVSPHQDYKAFSHYYYF